jgi:protease IV
MPWLFKRKRTKFIARIEVKGAIGPATRKRVLAHLKQVEERQFPALLLRIDSPGGTVGDSYEIYRALKHLQTKGVKIVATFGNISASGGVYLSLGAQHIVANPGTLTGSIGVILRGNNLEKLLERVGVSFQVIKSGPYKDILAFDRSLTDAEQEILQSLIDNSYEQFIQTVATERNLDLAAVRGFADGRIFTGEQALAYGTVDRLGTEEDARCWAAELAGLDPEKAKLFNFEESKPLLSRITSGGERLGGVGPDWSSGLTGPGWQQLSSLGADWLAFELETSGAPLWLYRP